MGIVAVARMTQPDLVAKAKLKKNSQMITLPYSHFNEFARWSLEYAGIEFDEYPYAPGQHILPVVAVRFHNGKNLSSTSYMKPVQSSTEKDEENDVKSANLARSTATPVMVTREGTILVDSWSIASYTNLPLPSEDMRKVYDDELGPLTRHLTYIFLLKDSNKNVWENLILSGMGWNFRMMWSFGLGRQVTAIMKKNFKPDDANACTICKNKLIDLFNRLDARVSVKVGKFLNGDILSIEDICLASLAAPVLLPPNYIRGKYAEQFGLLESQDPEAKAEYEYFRSTITGKYVLWLYETERMRNTKTNTF